MVRSMTSPTTSLLRDSGANSISMGRTPHEHRDEMCRGAART
jgi:hypothetical protein